jgi:succinoglycan biosynthesis protein ExoA
MNGELLSISVIIPSPEYSEDMPVLSSLSKTNYPDDKMEIIIATGNHPSVQRNKGAKAAKGDILYFFNNDSQTAPDLFLKASEIFSGDANIAGIGGPDLTPVSNNYLQHLFGYAMTSYFAHWKMRARYSEIGEKRTAGEKELLLSNLAVRKDVFLKADSFNERLYPNEENELINRIIEMGYKFIYAPEIRIYRDRRKDLPGFIKQFYKYGQGRMNQISIEGFSGNLPFLIPVLLSVYLLVLPFIYNFPAAFVPLFLYGGLGIIDAAILSFKYKKFLLIWLPFLYLLMHISYAAGAISRIRHCVACNSGIKNSQECGIVKIKELK